MMQAAKGGSSTFILSRNTFEWRQRRHTDIRRSITFTCEIAESSLTLQQQSSTPIEVLSNETWLWRGFPIRYQKAGNGGPAVLCIHGFGASSDHFRKNIRALAEEGCEVYAIDLIGFGKSAKPLPIGEDGNPEYTFETWSAQVTDFCKEVIGRSAFLAANSIGGIVALQAVVDNNEWVQGAALLDVSLRLLSMQKQAKLPWFMRIGPEIVMDILNVKPIGRFFFTSLAKKEVVKNILRQAYGRKEEVTDELVDFLLEPANEPGALESFLSFISYNHGPIPEELLSAIQSDTPIYLLWGAEDPWEPLTLGKELQSYPPVKEFVSLPGVGHCPQDEAPELVNPVLLRWIRECSSRVPVHVDSLSFSKLSSRKKRN